MLEDVTAAVATAAAFVFTGKEHENTISRVVLLDEILRSSCMVWDSQALKVGM